MTKISNNMKKLFIILGFISAIIATILSVTKFSNFAVAPIIVAFVSGLIVFFLSKEAQSKTKTIQYIFLLVIISLSLTIYKGVANSFEVDDTLPLDDTEQLQQQDKGNLNESDEIFNTKGSDEKI